MGQMLSAAILAQKLCACATSALSQLLRCLSTPQQAKINQAIGYWLEPKEVLGAVSILIVLLIAAYATTHRPDAASLKEQIEFKKEDTGKYV